jgi:hypothetical protein
MTSSTKNVKLGVCQVFYDNRDQGYTQGGVEVTVSTDTYQVVIDQFGKTPINEYIQGRQVSVKVPLAETTLRTLIQTMPGATLVTDGVQASGTVTAASNPTAANKVTVAGQDFSFQAGNPTTVYQVKLGATTALSMQAMCDAINLSPVANTQGGVSASLNTAGTVLTIACDDPGTGGNTITLGVTGSGLTASGANLAGGVVETKARVDVPTGVGIDMLTIAKQLRLHPIANAPTDYSEDFIVYKTATPGALSFAYKTDAERIYNCEFKAYPDPTSSKLFSIGDPLAA